MGCPSVDSLKKCSVQDILAHLLEQIGQTPEPEDQPNIHRYVYVNQSWNYGVTQKDRPQNEQHSSIDDQGGEQFSSIDDQGGEQSSSIDVKISVTLSFFT